MTMKIGDTVNLHDGCGTYWKGKIIRISTKYSDIDITWSEPIAHVKGHGKSSAQVIESCLNYVNKEWWEKKYESIQGR